jgi:hypothetical protein
MHAVIVQRHRQDFQVEPSSTHHLQAQLLVSLSYNAAGSARVAAGGSSVLAPQDAKPHMCHIINHSGWCGAGSSTAAATHLLVLPHCMLKTHPF